jgi:hypothetical protein
LNIAFVAFSTEALIGSMFNLSYMAVACWLLCPRLFPIIAVVAPVAACQLPNVRLKSRILISIKPIGNSIFDFSQVGRSLCRVD